MERLNKKLEEKKQREQKAWEKKNEEEKKKVNAANNKEPKYKKWADINIVDKKNMDINEEEKYDAKE